jgi:uncharacterized protein (TIGR03503 family)
MCRICLRMLWILSLTLGAPAQAAEPKPPVPDTRILIDVSGSMKQNDPDNLRQPALRLLVGLLPADSRAGVWTFGQYVNMLVPLGLVDEHWRRRARSGADKIHSRGLFTHIEEAVRRGTEDWSGPPGERERHLVLLTDGMVDVSKDARESLRSRQRVLEEQLPRLRDLGVKVHTVALSGRADHALLQRLSASTGGWAEQVASAAALQRVFLRIFEKVGNPDTLPLEDNRFKVDASIRELTLIVFSAEGAEPTRITQPNGQTFSHTDPPANVNWHEDAGFDLLTVRGPMAGEWRVLAQTDPDNRVIILTDLRMEVSDLPNRVVAGQRIPMQVRFTDGGQVITRREFIDVMSLSLEQVGPQGRATEPRPLRDDGQGDDPLAYDGRFELRFVPAGRPGRAELLVRAEGKTFQREKRRIFELLAPATAELSAAVDHGPVQLLRVRPVADVIAVDSLEVAAELEEGDGDHLTVELKRDPDGSFSGQVDTSQWSGAAKLLLRVRARTSSGDAVAAELQPLTVQGPVARFARTHSAPLGGASVEGPETPAQAQGTGLWALLGVGHLGLFLIAGLGIWLWRRRARRDLVLLVEDEAEGPQLGAESRAEERAA